LFHKFKPGVYYFVNSILCRRLAINPQERLRTGLPEKYPTIFVQKHFRAVQPAHFLYAPTCKSPWGIVLQFLKGRLPCPDWYVKVSVVVI